MESGRSFEARPADPRVDMQTQLEDMRVRDAFSNPESEEVLQRVDSVLWLRGAIGLRTERGASEVSDRELMVRLVEYGRYEWDPLVVKKIVTHLKKQGFSWSY